MNQGWHECKNNEIHFYHYRFNIPKILSQLSNHMDLIVEEKTTKLNPMAIPCAGEGDKSDFDIESWKSSDALNNTTNKNATKEEWKPQQIKEKLYRE